MMDVKVNREIRDYTESVFFGLSLRQFIFSAISCVLAVGIYFLCFSKLGSEITGWLCIIAVTPFAILGFVKYNGMAAEKVLIAIIKSEIISRKPLVWGNTNKIALALEEAERKIRRQKWGRKNVKNFKSNIKKG